MLIARQKKEENIAEYLLYMWQVEDIIRAYKFDINLIKQQIIDRFNQPEELKKEIFDWYDNLLHMMLNENIQESGHLQINKNVIIDLTSFHLSILQSKTDLQYVAAYHNALPYILDLKNKQAAEEIGDLEICFNVLYLTLMLRLQKKEISESTQNAVKQISNFIAHLSLRYKKDNDENSMSK